MAFNLTVVPLPVAPFLPGYSPAGGPGPAFAVPIVLPEEAGVAAAAAASRRAAAGVERVLVGALRAAQWGYEAAALPAHYRLQVRTL